MSGWITLNREIQNHWLWEKPEQLKAWCAILMAVNWERREIPNGGKVTVCERGQCIRSLDQWAEMFGKDWNKYKVRRFFKLLESASMIRLDNAIKAQRLTVVNYSAYQDQRNDSATETVGQTQRKRNGSATGKQVNNKTKKQTDAQKKKSLKTEFKEMGCNNPTGDFARLKILADKFTLEIMKEACEEMEEERWCNNIEKACKILYQERKTQRIEEEIEDEEDSSPMQVTFMEDI